MFETAPCAICGKPICWAEGMGRYVHTEGFFSTCQATGTMKAVPRNGRDAERLQKGGQQ